MDCKFSIVIPYYAHLNTIDFIKRQLNYYHFNLTPMVVILAVSGDEMVKVELEQFIKKLNDPRFVIFTTNEIDITNIASLLKKIFDALKRVTTPYVVINGADDVIIPEAVCHGSEIISNNLDIAGVKGRTVYFNCESGELWVTKDLAILNDCPFDRIKLAIKDRDSIFYIIRRTSELVKEYANIISLLEKSSIVSKSPYHIEHFIALSLASSGKVYVFKSPWRLQCSHKNNHSSHTPASFLRVELGVIDKATYEWFKSVNQNMHGLMSYRYYRFLWVCHQIRGTSVTLRQIVYNFIYKNCSLIDSIRIFAYFILNKIYIFSQKLLPEKCFGERVKLYESAEKIINTEQYSLLKQYYFSENDIKLLESKIDCPNKTLVIN